MSVGSVITFSCQYGYDLNGYNTLTCLISGQWDHDFPSCVKGSGTLSPPTHPVTTHGNTGPRVTTHGTKPPPDTTHGTKPPPDTTHGTKVPLVTTNGTTAPPNVNGTTVPSGTTHKSTEPSGPTNPGSQIGEYEIICNSG